MKLITPGLTWVFLVFFGVAHAAQTGTIAGAVKSGKTPLKGAVCTASGMKATTSTAGEYRIAGLKAGKHTVQCAAVSYKEQTRSVMVTAGKTATVNFDLKSLVGGKVDSMAKREEVGKVIGHLGGGAMVAPGSVGAGGMGTRGRISLSGYGRGSSVKVKRRGRVRPASKRRRTQRRPMPVARPPSLSVAHSDTPRTDHNTEDYKKITENDFKSATKEPLSTLSIDVDTASYSNARRFINQSKLPPKDAVQIEEFVNYFKYDYPDATGIHPFSITTEVSSAPWNPEHRLVHIGMQAKKIDRSRLPPTNLVFLLDVSGSMNNADKLPLLKSAFRLLVNNLQTHDRVAIVVYAGAAGVVLPSTSVKETDKILSALQDLRAGGSTAGGAGIQLAYKIAQDNFIKGGNNRVILATDGDFNVGVSSAGGLVRLIEEKRKSGVFLTVLGFGRGNYQASKMEQLADKGNGNFAYIDSILEAQKVLVKQMGGTLVAVAKDVKIQVEFNPTQVKGYRLLGYENRILAAQDFSDDKKDAGELGAGHTVTVLYEIIPAGSTEPIPGIDALKYQKTKLTDAANASEMMTVKLRYKKPTGTKSTLLSQPLVDDDIKLAKTSNAFRFSAAVVQAALVLRDSKYKGQSSLKNALKLAKGAMGTDENGYRFEFTRLVEKARLLKK
jgi:Ca-activated chloride channel family protein